MDIQHRAAFLRAARAWVGGEQRPIAKAVGIGLNTVVAAERGTSCTDKTWERMTEHYRSLGLSFVEDGDLAMIIMRQHIG